MGAKNKVISGDYSGQVIVKQFMDKSISIGGKTNIRKTNVKDYEVIDQTSNKSGVSAVTRGALGAVFLGPIGLLAGLSAKTKGIHVIAIEFVDGKRSLIEIDEKLYKIFMISMF